LANRWTLTRAFAHFEGAVARNPRWSWSARSPDGETVVLTLWEDKITHEDGGPTINCFGDDAHLWKDTLGNKDRTKNLIHARDHCDGLFRVVMVVAKDIKAVPRSIAKRYPHPTLVMKLIKLDERTGEFSAKSVRM
jgi:hypothetical protein